MSGRTKVVIIGAGFAGLEAAKRLCDKRPVDVVLVDRTNHHLFQPLLYQVATAGLSPAQIAAPIRGILSGCAGTRVLMAEVVGVDVSAKQVELKDGARLEYDYLLIATGATHSYFGHTEWARHAPGLKTIEDATTIRRRILCAFEQAERSEDAEERNALLTFAIIGAGPTGVELAGSLAELSRRVLVKDFRRIDPKDARILLLEAGSRVLAAFPPHLSERARRDLVRLGVEVHLDTPVQEVDATGVTTAGGERIASRTVLWAAGVKASPAADWLAVAPDQQGRVPVGASLEPDSRPNIFVVGDTARFDGGEGEPLPGVAPVAVQQAAHAARTILARTRSEPDPPPFRYRDKGNLATLGRASAVLAVRKIQLAGWLAWLAWMMIHVWLLIGFRNRLLVLIEWAWAYVTFDRGARLITHDDQ